MRCCPSCPTCSCAYDRSGCQFCFGGYASADSDSSDEENNYHETQCYDPDSDSDSDRERGYYTEGEYYADDSGTDSEAESDVDDYAAYCDWDGDGEDGYCCE